MTQQFAYSEKTQIAKGSGQILCFYINTTSRIQVIRITNIPNFHLERVVFPGQRLIFEAIANAKLEVHTNENATAICADTIPCHRLQMAEALN